MYNFKNLYVPYSPAMLTNFTDSTYPWLIRNYLKKFIDHNKPIPGLYLTRNHVIPGARGVLNESEVVEKLTNKGFVVVTGNESLKEIINLFYYAECIVGAHGSLFANTIFSKPTCKVFEFCPHNRIDYSFKSKYKAVKEYMHLIVNGDVNFNIDIQLDQLVIA